MSPWEPGPRLLGNLYIIILGTLTTFTWKTWEPFGNLLGTFWEPFGNLLGTLREPWGTLGTLREPWEPLLGNLGTFTWNLGTLGEWVLELLRSAPKPLLWLKTPKHSAVGEKRNQRTRMQSRTTLLWNKSCQQFRTFFPCYRTSVDCAWNGVECRAWSANTVKTVECWVGNVGYEMGIVECEVLGLKTRVWSVKHLV